MNVIIHKINWIFCQKLKLLNICINSSHYYIIFNLLCKKIETVFKIKNKNTCYSFGSVSIYNKWYILTKVWLAIKASNPKTMGGGLLNPLDILFKQARWTRRKYVLKSFFSILSIYVFQNSNEIKEIAYSDKIFWKYMQLLFRLKTSFFKIYWKVEQYLLSNIRFLFNLTSFSYLIKIYLQPF